MLNVLVVEDEKIEREALVHLIHEHFKDIIDQLIATSNGEQALQLFKENKFHLIISDINMPKMTGLDFLKQAKEISSDFKSIILTGYDYFQYAQEAIRIGVDDFILKPSTQQETITSIQRVIKQIQNKESSELVKTDRFQEAASVLKKDLIYAILNKSSKEYIKKILQILHLEDKNSVCVLLKRSEITNSLLEEVTHKLSKQYFYCIHSAYIEYYVFFIFDQNMNTEIDLTNIKIMLKESIGEDKTIKIGTIQTNPEDSYQSYECARNIVSNNSLKGYQGEREDTYAFVNTIVDKIFEEVYNGKSQNFISLSAVEFRQKCLMFDKKQLQESLLYLFESIKEKMLKDEDMSKKADIVDKYRKKIKYIASIVESYQCLEQLLTECIYPFIEYKRNKMGKLVVAAFEFIELNYQRSIGLNDLAAYLEVTPQYISSVLTSQTHSNFTTILAEYRINQAKLLLNTNLRIKEVSSMVGFQNQNYFAKTFKKITGYSPNEYKIKYNLE